MATSQEILNDIDLRYRNTYTTLQKLVWFNEEQRELFDVLELDSPPYAFTTVADNNYYPFPTDFDVTKIKTVTYQINDSTNPDYVEIDFMRNDDKQSGPYGKPWYTIVSDSMYLYTGVQVPENRTVYIYLDSSPDEVTTDNVSSSPSLPTKYQEILKLGVLKRIAMARKDIEFYQNYSDTYEQKLADIVWMRHLAEPEFVSAIDVMPHAGRSRYFSNRTAIVITQTE